MASASFQRRLVIILFSFIIVEIIFSIFEFKLVDKSSVQTVKFQKVLEPSDRKPMLNGYDITWFYKSEGIKSEEIFSDNDITIAVHMTIDRLYDIIQVAENWKGPISLAVFAPGEDIARLDDAIDGLRMCWPEVRSHVKFHVISLTSSQDEGEDLMKTSGQFVYLGCKDVLRRMKRYKSSYDVTMYPHNLMRNAALRGALTGHVMSLDAGMAPSSGLKEELNALIGNETDEKTAFVLPVFETKNEIRNIEELMEEYTVGNVQPYLYETCRGCHKPTDYQKWLKLSQEKRISTYEVEKGPAWEPFFLVSRRAPDFDEMARNYGFDRTSYICLLRTQGYKFKVVVGNYLTVRGLRSRLDAKSKHIRRMRDEEKFLNSFYSVMKARLKQDVKSVC